MTAHTPKHRRECALNVPSDGGYCAACEYITRPSPIYVVPRHRATVGDRVNVLRAALEAGAR